MPPTADRELQASFKNVGIPIGKKVHKFTPSDGRLTLTLLQLPLMQCRHCEIWNKAENVFKIKNHLAECEAYKKKQQDEARKQSNLVQSRLTMQKKASITRLTPEQVKILDKKAAYAIFCGARPFSLYDEPNMREFLNLLQPAYTVPH
jgi:hypothetical protein